ncbi:TolC family protein [Paracnuella aquatica]|uniref:TolC family protein n=1 Tax=Paracnuella aquatica TaxID=2268757 RepID=UPI000DEECEA4|nr:TolC family protein [Paracnuella aquatica]RPD43805.1 TolC family protein [Paracnuella aquatica]
MKTIGLSIGILLALVAHGQQEFTQQQLFDVIKAYHPVARQASLQVQIASAEVTAARGAFDPLLQSDISKKEFGGTQYYNHRLHQVNIPTWFGININAGLEELSGERTNPVDTKGASSFIGLSVPLANGLLMDGRRAALQQARIFEQASQEERRVMLNDLMQGAATAYWNWWQQYQTFQLFTEAAANAEQRFNLIKTAYRIGERPAIDTLEALAQLQTFRIQRAGVAQELQNARLQLSMYLWQQEGQPYDLPQTVTPVAPDGILLADADQLIAQHPALQQYNFKIDALRVDRRLKAQYLLPYITLKYNQLTGSHRIGDAFKSPLFENNYRYGVSMALPLRLSEGRGLYRQAKLKLEAAEWERTNKQVELEVKLRQYRNDWTQLLEQVALQRTAVAQYTGLQRAEEMKYANGESSLFLINSREVKTLEARQKLVELQAKQQKAAVSIRWAAGVLAD